MSLALLAGLLALPLASLSSNAGKTDGYLAEPKSGHGPGVLVLHAWWGLNADVKAYCDRLAVSGFIAYAPDLFHGQKATTRADAEALVKAYSPKEAELKAQIGDAAKLLAQKTGKPEMAVVGFSFGAYYALDFSNAEPAHVRAVVVYYGTGAEDFAKSKAAYLGHFAESDEFEPKPGVDHLAKLLHDAGRAATFHTYPGTGHWFAEPGVEGSYDKAATEQAWERTLAFLRRTLTE